MTDKSAKSNIIPSLRYVGNIDEDGKPTDRAIRWRDDLHFREVCEEIRIEVYPRDLLDIAIDLENDKDNAKRWLANTTGFGESAVNRILAVYLLLTGVWRILRFSLVPNRAALENAKNANVQYCINPK